jgi:hypothetical protein
VDISIADLGLTECVLGQAGSDEVEILGFFEPPKEMPSPRFTAVEDVEQIVTLNL